MWLFFRLQVAVIVHVPAAFAVTLVVKPSVWLNSATSESEFCHVIFPSISINVAVKSTYDTALPSKTFNVAAVLFKNIPHLF